MLGRQQQQQQCRLRLLISLTLQPVWQTILFHLPSTADSMYGMYLFVAVAVALLPFVLELVDVYLQPFACFGVKISITSNPNRGCSPRLLVGVQQLFLFLCLSFSLSPSPLPLVLMLAYCTVNCYNNNNNNIHIHRSKIVAAIKMQIRGMFSLIHFKISSVSVLGFPFSGIT